MLFPLGSAVPTVGARAPLRGGWSTLRPPAQGHVRGHADVHVLVILVLVSCRPRPRVLGLPPDLTCPVVARPRHAPAGPRRWENVSDIQTTTLYTPVDAGRASGSRRDSLITAGLELDGNHSLKNQDGDPGGRLRLARIDSVDRWFTATDARDSCSTFGASRSSIRGPHARPLV